MYVCKSSRSNVSIIYSTNVKSTDHLTEYKSPNTYNPSGISFGRQTQSLETLVIRCKRLRALRKPSPIPRTRDLSRYGGKAKARNFFLSPLLRKRSHKDRITVDERDQFSGPHVIYCTRWDRRRSFHKIY